MKSIFTFLLLIFIHFCVNACDKNLYNNLSPETDKKVILLCKERFAIGFSAIEKIPIWVSEKLMRINLLAAEIPRKDSFKIDTNVDAIFQSSSAAYKSSGFDRGHMVPFENVADDQRAAKESFLYTNIVPQHSLMNRGIWKSLENEARNYAISHNEIYVITGVSVEGSNFLRDGTRIPSALWKIIVFPKAQKYIAYLIPNTGSNGFMNLKMYRVEVSKIENAANIRFKFLHKLKPVI